MKKVLFVSVLFFSVINLFASETAKVYSAFIYHFTKYVEWPADMQNGDFVIAIVGDSEIMPYLNELAQIRTVGTQKIVIKKCTSVAEAKGAHIMYLDDSKLGDFALAKTTAANANTLLLTAKANYGRKGSMINFIDQNGAVKFELNQSAFKQAGLIVSGKLVNVAVLV